VGSILDYAAEADVNEGSKRSLGVPRDQLSARTYDYQGESECDFNTDVTLRSIRTAAELSRETGLPGYAAVKVTSIGQPELLQHVSQALAENRGHFLRHFLGVAGDGVGPEGQGLSHEDGAGVDTGGRRAAVAALRSDAVSDEVERFAMAGAVPGPGEMDLLVGAAEVAAAASAGMEVPSGLDPGSGRRLEVGVEEFIAALPASGVDMSRAEAEALFEEMDRDRSGTVDTLEWVDFMSTRDLAEQQVRPSLIVRPGGAKQLGRDELARVELMLGRARRLAEAAAEHGVTIMFDAEQTYLQPAIDHVVTRAQSEFNHDRAVVFNTYQAYLRDSGARVAMDLERSRREGFCFGAKIVRGAYMSQERKRAAELGYRDPIQPDIAATHRNYDAICAKVLDQVAAHSGASFMAASHNQGSVQAVVGRMAELGINPRDGTVAFGQLLGMCDHLSLTLGRGGYAVYKYVPYGPIKDVIPYLVRRAEENSGMLAAAGREVDMRWKEFIRRPPLGIH